MFCGFALGNLVAYQSLHFPCNLLLKVINRNYTFPPKNTSKGLLSFPSK